MDRGGAGSSGDTAATASPVVGASPVVSSVNDEFTGVGKGEGSGSGGDRGQGGDGTGRGFNPLATGVAGTGNGSGGNEGNPNFVSGATSGIEPPAASAGNSSSSKGLGAGAIAGIVIGLLALLGLIFFVLFLLRKKSPTVQKMFSKFGNQRPGSSYPTSVHGTEGMDKTLLTVGTGAAAGGGAAVAVAARRNSKAGQLPMRQTGNIPPPLLVSTPNTGRNLTSPTNDSPTSCRAFTPTPVSPMSPASILGSAPPPAAFYPGRPTYVPPENMSSYPGRPQYVPPAAATAAAVTNPYVPPPPARKPVPRSQTAPLPQQQPQAAITTQNLHVAHAARGNPHRSGSISSVSSGSALSAILNPAQMVWPMPPLTPPGSAPDTPKTGQGHGRHNSSKGSQAYVDFQATGQTVVRINNPPGPIRGQQRRPSGY